MNYKQTYWQETGGRYIWSPKTNRNGARNQSYDNMRLVVTGDIVFSSAQAEIRQLGIVTRPLLLPQASRVRAGRDELGS